MPKNVPLDNEAYTNFREWLRTTQVLWRDLRDSSIIPSWGEAICRKDILDDNGKTPGERAFITLKQCYPKLDLRWRKEELELLDLRPPKVFKGEYHGELFTVDISAAYAQIYSKLFLHSDFPRKRLKYPLREVAQRLLADKLGRNAVVGIARSTRNKWCQGEKVWYVQKQNKYLSPTLWGQIQMVLNEAAAIALEEQAIFVNTDGYAFTKLNHALRLTERLSTFGLRVKSLSGEGTILGISSLSIPGVKEPLEQNVSKPVFQLESTDGAWLEWWSKLE